ncbi:hypothetical protein NADFUDRAFT_24089 [Nadsonia fulvescens var. elongata DSM 6958]|uniref:Phosphatidic acid phosphatase type 2/haloperoxidase domain-containing protein n=1 Tax=Nadsonia fulvescens var. elongata DSM 6958 TaxID=857566 RepID=A0A1E3PKU8_9ASCO|nr:hypothetical protein NADFUDRAFT_24089 [Nadsonia fulvescens var. elongata DSM 6958]
MASYSKDDPGSDAGNKSLNHYADKLPPFRFKLRQALLPLIREETIYLAAFQRKCRCTFLDIYFAMTANLGTHTFFVIMLPIQFWFGKSDIGRDLIFVLAFGVYLSGALKDGLCLPRPLSPPLHRITMSGSAALEYGFPSTHTTNAISVALVFLQRLFEVKSQYSFASFILYQSLIYLYVLSIMIGRIYCGMHGFLDVGVGFILGVVIWYFRYLTGAIYDSFVTSGSYYAFISIPIVLVLVKIHPEPADNCPCYDDAVAFMGVVMGADIGSLFSARSSLSTNCMIPLPGTIAYDFDQIGLTKSILRIVVGIVFIFVWRAIMKPTMHGMLPPFFRGLEKIGLLMPRKYFTPASEYGDIPNNLPDSTLVEPREIPNIINKIGKHARRDSVGPQSTADVYESIGYREYAKERDSRKNSLSNGPNTRKAFTFATDDYNTNESEKPSLSQEKNNIQTPRVRYDVEVITKLIVYTGIAWIAIYACGPIFYYTGLGVYH